MNPDTFIDDFERTENSDDIQSIIGRALIMATRFDSMCEAAAIAIDIKKEAVSKSVMADGEFEAYASKIATKYRTLKTNIKSIGLPSDIAVILHDARMARNAVAHDLAKGLTGCLDTKIDEDRLIREISELIMDIAYGDIAISLTISMFNDELLPNEQFIASYKDKIVNWVVKR